jgi:inner membrane protein
MSPVTHALVGWMVANYADRPRDRALIMLAGVVPDLDGLGIIPEVLTANSSHPLPWFTEYHHILGHNIAFAALTAMVCFVMTRSWKTTALATFAFHLHLLCDVLGARGPDGFSWPIAYLLPFSDRWQWEWSGQWALNAWPNMVLTMVLLLVTFYLSVRRGFSPLEWFAPAANRAFVRTLRSRFASA